MSNNGEPPAPESPKNPMTERQEHYAVEFINAVWACVEKASAHMAAHELVGILSGVSSKIEFDLNIRSARDMAKKMKEEDKPSKLIDKHGFPIE